MVVAFFTMMTAQWQALTIMAMQCIWVFHLLWRICM